MNVDNFKALISGEGWYEIGKPGAPVFLTYSFETAAQKFLVTEGFYAEFVQSFRTFSEHDRELARAALTKWEEVSGIKFLEVAPGKGEIKFGKFRFDKDPNIGSNTIGFAYYPDVELTDEVATVQSIGGDIFIDSGAKNDLLLLLHEIGHAIGLKHPFEGDYRLPPHLDHAGKTVMSYDSSGFKGGPGTFDDDAARHLYGERHGANLVSWSWDEASQLLTRIDGADGERMYGVGVRDSMSGGGGRDSIAGFAGDDTVDGGAGNDLVYGGDGDDRLSGQTENDDLRGENGNDIIEGGDGHDTMHGGEGYDSLDAGAGNDIVMGGEGNDTVRGGLGNDTMYGGHGVADGSTETFDCGFATSPLVVDLNQRAVGKDIGFDKIFGFVHFISGSGSDIIDGNYNDNNIHGGSGDDTISSLQGRDTIDAGDGNDLLKDSIGDSIYFCGPGDDTYEDSTGADRVFGGMGNDTIALLSGRNVVDGGEGIDTLICQEHHRTHSQMGAIVDLLRGRATGVELEANKITGFEVIIGSEFDDRLSGDDGANTIVGGLGQDTIDGRAGFDTTDYSTLGAVHIGLTSGIFGLAAAGDRLIGIERIIGSLAGDDRIAGTSGREIFDGLGGQDRLDGLAGSDVLNGGGGGDRLNGRAGADALNGGGANDRITGGSGNDKMTGGEGIDRFIFDLAAFGKDIITDFADGIDRLQFKRAVADSFDDLSIIGNGTRDLTLTVNGNSGQSISLHGVFAITLTAEDFVFFA